MACSSLTLGTKDRRHFLARTMDFTLDPGSCVLIMPRGQSLTLSQAGNRERLQYAILGMGTKDPRQRTLYDGVNENGVAGAVLYYPGAVYSPAAGARNPLNPLSALLYLLGNSRTLADVKQRFADTTLVDEGNAILGHAPPLHFVFTDRTGRTLIAEPDEGGISYYEDNVGVLTNAPSYAWHETNLRNYIGLRPWPAAAIEMNGKTLRPFGQGSGTWGLPGDYTGPSRFVRTAYMKANARQADNELDGVNQCLQILSSVNIPQGAVVNGEGHSDYTRYTCAIGCESLTYYFQTYSCRRIQAVRMTGEAMSAGEPLTFDWPDDPEIHFLNGDR